MRRAIDEGIARPIPWYPPVSVSIAVLMPTTLPERSTRGPPELPELIAASVCRNASYSLILRSLRSVDEMMPAVTVWSRANGLPMARTQSPMSS